MKTTLSLLLVFLLGQHVAKADGSPFNNSAPFNNSSSFSTSKVKGDKDGDPDHDNGWGNNRPKNVPFDGGLTVLLAAGTVYGFKKYRSGKATANKLI